MKRFIKWIFILLILAVGFVFIGLPMLANTAEGRRRLAEVLGNATNRKVELGKLKVGFFYSSVKVGDLRIQNPEGFAGDFLNAGELAFDAKLKQLFDGRVVGKLKGSGLTVNIIRKNGKSNLDGFGGEKKESGDGGGTKDGGGDDGGGDKKDGGGESGKSPDLDLMLELLDSKLTIKDIDKGETLVLEGVSLEMKLTNKAGEAGAGIKIRIKEIAQDTITVRDLEIDAKQAGDYLDLERLVAKLPGKGGLTGTGRLRVKNGDDWAVKLKATDVGLEEDMMPLVASMYPLAVSKAKGQVGGILGAEFDVRGNGLTWEAMKPSLSGTGSVKLTDLNLPSDSMLVEATQFAAALAGKNSAGGPMRLKNAGAVFGVENGWLNFQRLSASGDKARYDLAGRVSLDGKLDLTMDLMPIVNQFGTLDPKIAKYLKSAPLRIQGTSAQPKYRLPKPEDILKEAAKGAITDEINKGLGGLLDKVKKKDR